MNPLLHHILCPVDFSELSALGLRYADSFAKCSGARITVVYADTFSPPPYFTGGSLETMRRQRREQSQAAEHALRRFVEAELGGNGVSISVVEGLPVDGILAMAEKTGAEMIVIGTHGRSGVQRWMMGSVAERLLRESAVPVLTVRGDTRASPAIRQILCPVNDTPLARASLEFATRAGSCLGASVIALHVRESDGKQPIRDLCAWIQPKDRERCELRELVREGEAAEQIVAAAQELGCDLLVMGAGRRRFFDSAVIGTTTVRVVRHAPCPVLTVMREAE